MSNSALIKKVKDAEKKAAEMRLKAMEDSRIDIRQAEEDTSKEKEQNNAGTGAIAVSGFGRAVTRCGFIRY